MTNITVVGGGAAGWIAAALLDHGGHNVTLIESPNIPIMGVGESTLPFIKTIFEKIGLEESEWLHKCNGIVKHGNTKQGFKSKTDDPWMFGFWYDTDIYESLDNPKRDINSSATDYAYHIASEELPAIFKDACPNVTHIIKNLTERPECDLLIDCTGNRKMFIEDKTLITSDKHIMNSAVVAPWSFDKLEWTGNESHSYAMDYGWQFYIPLKDRVGSGYIYSDRYISDDDAIKEYLSGMKGCTQLEDYRVIKWVPGFLKNPWSGDTVGIGMSSLFLDPLEASALAHIQTSTEMLIKCLDRGYSKETYNKMIRTLAYQTSDIVATYYAMSDRTDTDFWLHFKPYREEMLEKIAINYKSRSNVDTCMWPSAIWASLAIYFDVEYIL